MEDATVTTVDEDFEFVNDQPLDATPSEGVLDFAMNILTAYGWYFIALLMVIVFYWEKIQQKLDKWYNDKSEREYDAKCKKDPDWLKKRQEEMDAARRRMQEELNAKAALHAAKLKEKEEQRRAELLAAGNEGGHRLGSETSANASTSTTTATTNTKKAYRPEYNPLMGSGGSGGYRPPRRGCPGGGCG